MIYKTYQDLSDSIRRNVWKIPYDVDIIVGIPRSGMIPALMLAELLNKRCADLDAFIEGREMSCGARGIMMREGAKGKVLVIDDSISSGSALRLAKERLLPLESKFDIIYCCVYSERKNSKDEVDIYLEDIYQMGEKHRKEWNILRLYPKMTKSTMWDIDGLLCKDPPNDNDTVAYEKYLPNAIPMIIPTTPIGALVTYRLEKYRGITEKWLHEHNVEYGELMMFNAPDRDSRNTMKRPSRYKAELYGKASWAKLFYESSRKQAEKIHLLTGKPVFCYENGMMYM